jgi:hypothetical protein
MPKYTLILTNGHQFETWGSLTELCNNHPGFSYNYLKRLPFPINYKGWQIVKVPHRVKRFNI